MSKLHRCVIVLKVNQQLVCIIHDTAQVITNMKRHIPNISQSANPALAKLLVIVFQSKKDQNAKKKKKCHEKKHVLQYLLEWLTA